MEDQETCSKSSDPHQNDIIFFNEDDIPICVDVENLILFDCNEDSQNVSFKNEDPADNTDDLEVIQTIDVPSQSDELKIVPNCSAQSNKSKKRWCQKEVTVKTIESEFKVLMWVLDDNNQNDEQQVVKTEPSSKRKEGKIDTVPIVSLLKPKQLETPKLSQQNTLPSIKCTIRSCRMLFKDVTSLREHLRQHVSDNSNSFPNKLEYVCTFENCPKSFKDISSLRKHLHTHGPKTKVCAECGKAFIDNSKLNRHLIVHTGDKPFKCCFAGCGKRFSLDFNLRTHARIHTGYRPFPCTYEGCNKRFAQSTNLKSHQMIHLKKIQMNRGSMLTEIK